jgi:hypothetical protein
LTAPRAIRAPMLWGIVVGLLQATTPLVFWWLSSATSYAFGLVVIAAVYVGFAVADGRPGVIAVESSVTFAFVVVAAAAVTGHRGCSWPAWPGTASRTSGSTAATSSPTHDGGHRSAWWSTGWSPRSSLARSPQACTSASGSSRPTGIALDREPVQRGPTQQPSLRHASKPSLTATPAISRRTTGSTHHAPAIVLPAVVYPTLAAISDAVTPVARASMVGVYRFWRDMGYVAGALIAGVVADALGFGGAIAVVAALTAASGLWVALDMPARRAPESPLAARARTVS